MQQQRWQTEHRKAQRRNFWHQLHPLRTCPPPTHRLCLQRGLLQTANVDPTFVAAVTTPLPQAWLSCLKHSCYHTLYPPVTHTWTSLRRQGHQKHFQQHQIRELQTHHPEYTTSTLESRMKLMLHLQASCHQTKLFLQLYFYFFIQKSESISYFSGLQHQNHKCS